MTVKELVAILNTLPSDATVVYAANRFIADEVIYDDYDNTVTFAGTTEFDDDPNPCDGCEAGECHHCYDDIPDDVDESNYDPYCGCDVFEYYSDIDKDW